MIEDAKFHRKVLDVANGPAAEPQGDGGASDTHVQPSIVIVTTATELVRAVRRGERHIQIESHIDLRKQSFFELHHALDTSLRGMQSLRVRYLPWLPGKFA